MKSHDEALHPVERRLSAMGLSLPEAAVPGGNYVSVNIRDAIAYVAIQFPIFNGGYHYQGKLGEDVTTDEGYKAMQLCALNLLAQIKKYIGWEKLLGFNHLDAYYQAAEDWDEGPIVVNGASDLLTEVLAEKGKHSRAIFGVAHLPRNFAVGLTATLTLSED